MARMLKLKFIVEPKGSYTLEIEEPKVNMTEEQVITMMQMIIEKSLFKPKTGTLKAIESAEIVETTTSKIA